MQWVQKYFSQLTTTELYQILKLRCDIFVVEQNCAYSDLDNLDTNPNAIHLFNQGPEISAYLRILPPDCGYPKKPSFGRVVVAESARGSGLAHQLVHKANQILDVHWPGLSCHISAQAHLKDFYQQHNYQVVGEGYLEDNIPHIGMERVVELD
jgi:ElaA protein